MVSFSSDEFVEFLYSLIYSNIPKRNKGMCIHNNVAKSAAPYYAIICQYLTSIIYAFKSSLLQVYTGI